MIYDRQLVLPSDGVIIFHCLQITSKQSSTTGLFYIIDRLQFKINDVSFKVIDLKNNKRIV
jgi:hypothetical protein